MPSQAVPAEVLDEATNCTRLPPTGSLLATRITSLNANEGKQLIEMASEVPQRIQRVLAGGPIQYASSASQACGAERSALENTATLSRPSALQARIARTAISPRLAIKTRWRMRTSLSLRGQRHNSDIDKLRRAGQLCQVTRYVYATRDRSCSGAGARKANACH